MLFDLGETLLEFGRVDVWRLFQEAAASSHAYLKEQGQPVRSLGGYKWWSFLTIRTRLLLSDWTRRDWDSLEILRRVGARGGYSLTEEQFRELNWRWYEPLGRLAHVEPGLVETLGKLRGMGLRLGIVSNTWVNGDSLERHLRQFGVLDFFEVRIYSCGYRFRKPDRRLFREATERLGVLPGHVLFVGDRIDADVKGAVGAGMVPVLKRAYTNVRKRAPAGVERIERIAELPGVIARLNGPAPA